MRCTWLRPSHLSIHVGNGSRRSEEIVENLELHLLNVIIIINIIITVFADEDYVQLCDIQGSPSTL